MAKSAHIDRVWVRTRNWDAFQMNMGAGGGYTRAEVERMQAAERERRANMRHGIYRSLPPEPRRD
jgi:hypothetical protein